MINDNLQFLDSRQLSSVSLGIPPECMAKPWKKIGHEKDAKKRRKKRRSKRRKKKMQKKKTPKKDAEKRCKKRRKKMQKKSTFNYPRLLPITTCYYIQLLLLLLEGSTQWSVAEWCEVSLSHSKKLFVKWQGCLKTNRRYRVKQFKSTILMSCCTLSEIPNILPIYLFSTVTDH